MLSMPDGVKDYVDAVAEESGRSPDVPVVSKAKVYRALLKTAVEEVEEGNVDIDGIDIRKFKEFDEEIEQWPDSDDVAVTCDSCGYTWTYTGDLEKATCPSCTAKADVNRGGSDDR